MASKNEPQWEIVYLPPGQFDVAQGIVKAAVDFIKAGGGHAASDGIHGTEKDNALARLKEGVERLVGNGSN